MDVGCMQKNQRTYFIQYKFVPVQIFPNLAASTDDN